MHLRTGTLYLSILLLLLSQTAFSTTDISIRTSTVSASGKAFKVRIVKASLDMYRVKVGLAYDKIGATSSVGAIATRNGAAAAINGTFFDAYTSSSYKLPYNTIVTNGVIRNAASFGSSLGFDADGNYMLDRVTWSNSKGPLTATSPEFWQNAMEVMGCGPTLVKDGKISLDARAEGFKETKIISGSAQRSAVGLTSDRHIIMATCKATMQQLAQIMQALGAVDAMNLDGGGSSSLWVKGRYVTGPGRAVSNALLLVPIARNVRSPLPDDALFNIEQYDPGTAWDSLKKYPQIFSGYNFIIDAVNSKRLQRLTWILSPSFKWDIETRNPATNRSTTSILDYGRSLDKLSEIIKQAGISPRWMYKFMLCKSYDNGHCIVVLAYRNTVLPYTPHNPSNGKGAGTMEAVENIWSMDTDSGMWQLMYERSRIID